MAASIAEPFGVYVHWPFCLAKCPYCDFNSHVRAGLDATRWSDALLRELVWSAGAMDPRPRSTSSIFFGGGTPSLMQPGWVGSVISTIDRLWPLTADCEITLEANPTSVEASRFKGYRAAGVNRLSLGVQALDDDDLRWLGRQHSAQEALAALALAQSVFERVSLDLIYARPNQTAQAWEAELSRAIDLGTEHLSLYQLTFEEGTAFELKRQAGSIVPLKDDLAAALYELTGQLAGAAGYSAYEVSNYAQTGAESRHNLLYWRYGEYLGVGPGAHARLAMNGWRAQMRLKGPEAWLNAVQLQGHGMQTDDPVSSVERGEEALLMGLRLAEGVFQPRIEALLGRSLSQEPLMRLKQLGLITQDQDRLQATARGRMVLNRVIAEILEQ